MAERLANTAELREMRDDMSRALIDIGKGARLIRDGKDVTDAHKAHLQALLADIDAKLLASEGDHGRALSVPAAT